MDNQYVILVLNQISLQLHKHYALLTYNLKRQDVDLCSVMVAPTATCLQNCLLSLDQELDKFEHKVSIIWNNFYCHFNNSNTYIILMNYEKKTKKIDAPSEFCCKYATKLNSIIILGKSYMQVFLFNSFMFQNDVNVFIAINSVWVILRTFKIVIERA